jgi:sugar lactone lactonase YvrE
VAGFSCHSVLPYATSRNPLNGANGAAILAAPRLKRLCSLGDGVPDGICLDAEGAVWYADVPNKRCVRVREGGEVLQRIELDRGCFACALGGADRSTLFMKATEWNGPAGMFAEPRTGQVLTVEAPAPGVGWP